MNYRDKLKESKEKVYNFAIATKILDLMDKLRMDATNSSERRWVWELLQNAKDVGFDDKSVSVEINFDKLSAFVELRHNGKPFTVDNITFLIEQVSTKERKVKEGEKPKTTGKFGTGFLTTHLLSEKVDLSGVVKEPELPYRKFEIHLDRSGREIQEITDSVNASISVLESLDSYPAFEAWNPDSFNTAFRYNLDSKGIEVAEIGIADLHIALPFTLAFLPKIAFVSIPSENLIYQLESIENLTEVLKIARIIKANKGVQKPIEIVTLENNDVSIAIEIERKEGKVYIKELDKFMPRLFCDFPLIGTEDFYFPVVTNSSLFNPNEPRNGIYLIDKAEQKVLDNKELMTRAVELYYSLLDFAAENDWQNMFHLAAIWQPNEKSWVSKSWFESEILTPIRKKLLSTKIVDTESRGRLAFEIEEGGFIDFPYHANKEVREKIWELCVSSNYFILPLKDYVHDWYHIVWDKKYALTLETITIWINSKKCLTELSKSLSKTEEDTIAWLNLFFDLLNFEGKFISEITNDKFSIIPNQNGNFKKKSELSIDSGIDEELKSTLLILGQNWHELLIHKKVHTGEGVRYAVKSQDNAIDEINKIIKDGKNENISKACDHLSSCFSDDNNFPVEQRNIYEFSQVLWDMPEKREITNWSEKIWQEVNKLQINWLIQTIAESKNVEQLGENIKFDKSKTIDWLNTFVEFLVSNGYGDRLNLKTSPILPNQNGNFCIKDDLFLDDGDIDETLKSILESLGYELREELLELSIYLELPKNRERNQEFVADEISKLIKPLFAEFPRSPETKQIFKSLYLWFSKNKPIAENIFEELYKNKHKLYDDDEIAENIQKAEILDEILSEQGITLEQLKELSENGKLKSLLNENTTKPKVPISVQDALISLGISTAEDLENALKDRIVYEQFGHISEASIEMLEYVMSLIERAKENVKKHLSQLPEYDTTSWREVAKTVISGVSKNGKLISIVVRPSDGGQVIFYYSSEKDTLEQASAELWIDDDKKEPQHLTLGRILKRNRIDKISV